MRRKLSLSFELVYLLRWLCREDNGRLRGLVKEAVEKGIVQDLEQMTDEEYLVVSDDLYNSVVDFVSLLEDALVEEMGKTRSEEEFLSKLLTRWNPSSNEPIN